jgi:hypothetical protein
MMYFLAVNKNTAIIAKRICDTKETVTIDQPRTATRAS